MNSWDDGTRSYTTAGWQQWATSVLSLVKAVFGDTSPHYVNLQKAYAVCRGYEYEVDALKGVFRSAKDDFDGGYLFSFEVAISGEIFGDFIALAKSKPGRLSYSSGGNGSAAHITFEYLKLRTRTFLLHIPYRGTAPSVTDLIAGQVRLMFDGLPAAAGNIHTGKLRLLAITGKERAPSFPDVPTFAEAGLPDYAPIAWQGLLAPAGTPKPVLEKLSAAMRKACQSSELARKWRDYGGELRCNTPAEFKAFIDADRAMWGKVIREARIKLD